MKPGCPENWTKGEIRRLVWACWFGRFPLTVGRDGGFNVSSIPNHLALRSFVLRGDLFEGQHDPAQPRA